MGRPRKPDIERFLAKVTKTRRCWLWQGSLKSGGYGQFRSNELGFKMIGAHQFAWIKFKGEIPTELCVLHRCDNPRCVNPRHLFLGTYQDNYNDMVRKGRRVVCAGPSNGMFGRRSRGFSGRHHTDASKAKITESNRRARCG